MDHNRVFSKSLKKMLKRKLAYQYDPKKMRPQLLKQNPQSQCPHLNLPQQLKQENSPSKSKLHLHIEENKPKGLHREIDYIMRLLTEETNVELKNNRISKKQQYCNYRIVTQPIVSLPRILNKAHRAQSYVRLPHIEKAKKIYHEVDLQGNIPKTRMYTSNQKLHQGERMGFQQSSVNIQNITRHYRAGLTSFNIFHRQ